MTYAVWAAIDQAGQIVRTTRSAEEAARWKLTTWNGPVVRLVVDEEEQKRVLEVVYSVLRRQEKGELQNGNIGVGCLSQSNSAVICEIERELERSRP